MDWNYFDIAIGTVMERDRWHWRATLPTGMTITSNQGYATPVQAISCARLWITTESMQRALEGCLVELRDRGTIQDQEYRNLMRSLEKQIQA
ncbi:MAG: hypothetical protein Fur0046_31080 [Cyanobacteria bacterium J069]